MTKFKTDRRCGVERREFQYSLHIPERRSGIDRRRAKKGKEIIWIKYKEKTSKLRHHDMVVRN